MSDFLIESVFHNVRNTFTHNLLAQMAYVVQKLSTRSIPASVVAFCGKATAYAFFYCDGIASVLVRLWGISADTLRQLMSEYGFSRGDNLSEATERLNSCFPACIRPLAFRSIPSMTRHLRTRPHLPIAVAGIPWQGPWVSRWNGRDTDFFFIFVKHFSDLVCRHVPEDMTLEEQLAAPAWALVQAQFLKVIQMNITRTQGQQASNEPTGSHSMAVDEMLGDVDAAANVIPLAANSLNRSMAENRVIMLLRDCLANTNIMTEKAQSMFANVFNILLKAAARRISLYDHNSCFTLCDFLEEAIGILTRYHRSSNSNTPGFDWDYWFLVCKHMLRSENTVTEIRVYAFLYSMWGVISEDEERKRKVSVDWLLSEGHFHTYFNHWCPMVRAYYMRLIMWKVARPAYKGNPLDK